MKRQPDDPRARCCRCGIMTAMTFTDSSGGAAPTVVGGRRGSAPFEDLHLDSLEVRAWPQEGLSERERFDMWRLDRGRAAYRDALARFGVGRQA